MGLLIMTYANLVNVWKTSGEAGKQRVKCLSITVTSFKAGFHEDISLVLVLMLMSPPFSLVKSAT